MAAPALTGVSGVGYYGGAGGSPTTAVTGSMTTTAGRGMVAVLVGQDATAASFSDSKGNTWANAGTAQLGNVSGFAVYAQIGYCASITSGGSGHTVTGTSTTDGYSTIVAFEVDQAIAFDAQAGADVNASPWASSITTGVADTLAVAGIVFGGTSGWTLAASGWTWFGEVMAGETADWDLGLLTRSVASAGATSISVTPTGGGTGSEATIKLASFKVASGGGVTCTLAVTDSADAVVSAATVSVATSLARTDAADTLAASAAVPIAANLGAADTADAIASTVVVRVAANANATDTADSLSSTAVVGNPPVTCDLSVTDAGDSLSALAAALVIAAFSATDAEDSLSAAAQASVATALAVSDAADALSAVAVTSGPITATLAVIDEDDSLASALSTSTGAGDYEETKKRKRRILEQLARQVLEDEKEPAEEKAEVVQPKPVQAKSLMKAKVLPRVVDTDDEDEIEALLLM